MKNLLCSTLVALAAMSLLSGCIGLSLGGGTRTETANATVGQQLADLQKAKNAGAINEAEFQAQKTKLLQQK